MNEKIKYSPVEIQQNSQCVFIRRKLYGHYGSNFINSLSAALKTEFPDASGYSPRNLARMKIFYEEYRNLSNLPPAVANLPWTHNYLLLEKVKDKEKRYG